MDNETTEQPALKDPALPALKSQLDKVFEHQGDLDERREIARTIRHAIWDGQSDDGLKHEEDLGEAPFPWEGSGDARIFLADDIINEQVAMLREAFFRAEINAVPTRITALPQAQRVQDLLRWLRNSALRAELDEQTELAAQYMLGDDPGLCIVAVFWRRGVQLKWVEVSITEILERLDQAEAEAQDGAAAAEAANITDILYSEAREEEALDILAGQFPTVQRSGLKRALRELRTEGKTRLPRPETTHNLPSVQAYRLGEDIFLLEGTSDLQRTPVIFTVEYLTEEELRARVIDDDWDQAAVDAVIAAGPGQRYQPSTYERKDSEDDGSATLRDQLFEIWCGWRRANDEGGVPVSWRTHFAPCCADERLGPLKHEPVDMRDGKLPFHAFRRERLSRSIFDSRGVTRVAGSAQTEIKTQRDCRTNYTQLATVPPLKKQMRRQGVQLVFGPAAELPIDRGDDVAFLQMPPFPQASVEMENAVRRDVDNYFGRENGQTAPSKVEVVRANLVRGWLNGWACVFEYVLKLCQENLEPETVLSVTGAPPSVLLRDEIGGEFRLQLTFDVRELNLEFLQARMDYYGKILPLDSQGQLDRAKLVKIASRGIDPNLADQIVQDVGVVTAKEAADEVDAIAKIAVGIEVPPPEQANWQLRLQVLDQTVTRSPKLAALLQQDPEGFGKAIQARREAFTFQLQQQQNAMTGRTGFMPTQTPTLGTTAAAQPSP